MAACASLAPPIGHRVLGGAMFLLVVGLVAVIIAILVAAFLSMRRGSDDEDGPVERLSVRDRVRSRGRDRDARWNDADAPRPARRAGAREPVPSRRPGRAPHEYTADGVADRVGFDSMRGYEASPGGYGGRMPGRGADRARGDRTGRYDDATEAIPRPAAGALRAAAAAPAGRRAAAGFDTGPGAALYDTGPAPAIDADPDLADSDVFPRVREDIPRPAAKPRQPGKPRQRSQPAKGRGRPAAGTTTMTLTGRAPSGTSCPTSSTGLSCPRTSRCRTRPSRPLSSRRRPGRRPRAARGGPPRPGPPPARNPAGRARPPSGRRAAPRGRRARGSPTRAPRPPGRTTRRPAAGFPGPRPTMTR